VGRPPIVVELHGRLGNQLFQYAIGRALARRHDAELLFDVARPHPDDLVLPELVGELPLARDDLLLRLGHRDPRRPRHLSRYVRSELARARARLTRRPVQVVERTRQRFDPAVVAARPPYLLRGFFQVERYFAGIADELDATIRLPELPAPADPRPAVAVSFRRGDYVGHPWALPVRYQERALERLCADVRPASLVVFCDDLEFAGLVAPHLERFAPARVCAERDPARTLAEMVRCDHFVIPNSTFGWWAAWLGERRPGEHAVVAPEGWMDASRRTEVIPDRWLRVDRG
jgi:hypothetical protein